MASYNIMFLSVTVAVFMQRNFRHGDRWPQPDRCAEGWKQGLPNCGDAPVLPAEYVVSASRIADRRMIYLCDAAKKYCPEAVSEIDAVIKLASYS